MSKIEAETKARLERAATLTETEVPSGATKKEIVVALMENEIDEEYYFTFVAPQLDAEDEAAKAAEDAAAAEEEEYETPKPAKGVVTTDQLGNDRDKKEEVVEEEEVEAYNSDTDETLVRYTGFSGTVEKMGYRWTRAHPFTPVKGEDLERLLAASNQFRIASPKEAQDFYA